LLKTNAPHGKVKEDSLVVIYPGEKEIPLAQGIVAQGLRRHVHGVERV
jgi:hypothetical protein